MVYKHIKQTHVSWLLLGTTLYGHFCIQSQVTLALRSNDHLRSTVSGSVVAMMMVCKNSIEAAEAIPTAVLLLAGQIRPPGNSSEARCVVFSK
jgi:hypothetical protein